MSYAQGILKAVAGKSLTAETCSRLIRGLDAIPEVFHADFVVAYFKEPDQEPEEQLEDYLAVKTFTSTEFHIGDEIIEKHGLKGIYVGSDDENKISVVYELGGAESGWDKDKWHRTGRNFPAIPAIMEELKNA